MIAKAVSGNIRKKASPGWRAPCIPAAPAAMVRRSAGGRHADLGQGHVAEIAARGAEPRRPGMNTPMPRLVDPFKDESAATAAVADTSVSSAAEPTGPAGAARIRRIPPAPPANEQSAAEQPADEQSAADQTSRRSEAGAEGAKELNGRIIMRARFILSETWANLTRNLSMLLSLTLVTFISFLFIGASVLTTGADHQSEGRLVRQGRGRGVAMSRRHQPVRELCFRQIALSQEITALEDGFAMNSATWSPTSTMSAARSSTTTRSSSSTRTAITRPYADRVRYAGFAAGSSSRTPPNIRWSRKCCRAGGCGDVIDQRQIFDPVFAVLNRATAVTAVLAGVMVVVAILLTATTIRMSAASRKNETEIMSRGCLELDDSSAVHSGGRGGVADGIAAASGLSFGYRQRVRHRLVGEIRYMDSLCESAHGTGDIAVPGCGRDTAVHHRFNHLVAALFEGVTRPAYPREM